MALGFWSHQLAEPGFQPADRPALRQYPARRHDLRSTRAAAARAWEAVRQPIGQADRGDRRSEYSRLPPGGWSTDRPIMWKTPYRSPNYSSTMVTASNLVFTGVMTGEFQAL